MKYLSNSFSLNMVNRDLKNYNVYVRRIIEPKLDDYMSCVGHEDLARLIGVHCNRCTIALNPDDELLVAQYIGERLPLGCTKLPDGSKIDYFIVWIKDSE